MTDLTGYGFPKMSSSADIIPLVSSEYFLSSASTGILSMDFRNRDEGGESQSCPE